jgi:hypothetical protein
MTASLRIEVWEVLMSQSSGAAERKSVNYHCAQPPRTPIALPAEVNAIRARAVRISKNKWMNGTVLHYCFLQREGWDWPDDQKDVVRWAFGVWRDLNVGLRFVEVTREADAEIKIGRRQNNRSWSFVGVDILKYTDDDCTMNFGWDLRTEWGHATALHEIGHTLGLEHEHQNPKAGIVWDEEAVYESFKQSNDWERDVTYHNILEKLDPSAVAGSQWDPTSIMHYPFEPGLIKRPQPYDVQGVDENIELSANDIDWALRWYPPLPDAAPITALQVARLSRGGGTQRDFLFQPEATREYQVQTLGTADCKIVIFEERDGEPRHFAAEDDSGMAANATIRVKMIEGRRYLVRVRVHYAPGADDIGVVII